MLPYVPSGNAMATASDASSPTREWSKTASAAKLDTILPRPVQDTAKENLALREDEGNGSSAIGGMNSRYRSFSKGNRSRRRSRQRWRLRTEVENDLFTGFTLNRDPENSKYLPYNEVIYPRIFNRPKEVRPQLFADGTRRISPLVAAAELDNMWTIGFIENARRHQKDLLLRELRDFIRLPGSDLLPGAHAALATISKISAPTNFNSSAIRNTKSQRGGGRAESADTYSERESAGRYRAGGADSNYCVSSQKRPISERASALSSLEKLRLRELEHRLSQASLGVEDVQRRRHASIAAYRSVNRKLRKILRGTKPPVVCPAVKSQSIEAVLQRNRSELEAAIRIQRLYKCYYRKRRFSALICQLRGVIRIQSLARGVLARRFVAEWYAQRRAMVIGWQTVIRRMLSNIRWRRQFEAEQQAASRMQSVIRGYTGRKKARQCRASLAALRIQCLWRGCVARVRADRLWLGAQVTRIQGLVRMLVAKRFVDRRRRICNAAARSIQRCFRGMVARNIIKRLIWERSLARRIDFLRMLAAEEEWEREDMELMQHRSRRMRLEERLEQVLSAEAVAHAAVVELENNKQELETQRQMLSPRALEQGWKEELDKSIDQHRGWIMRKKLEAVFDAALPARELEEEVRRRDETLREREMHASRLARWRESEMEAIFERESRRRFDDHHLEQRRKIADEKRKWAVQHYTLSGKPDKLKARRRSRPWEAFQDPAERILKQVYTGGNVDLFADDRSPHGSMDGAAADESTSHARAETSDRVGAGNGDAGERDKPANRDSFFTRGALPVIMARLQLQSHINQVAQLEKIMHPAQDIIQRTGLDPIMGRGEIPEAEASTEPPPLLPPPQTAALGILNQEDDEHGEPEPEPSRPVPGRISHRLSAAGFPDRYGAAASTPTSRPPPVGTGGTQVPTECGEEERVRARIRQRRLYMLSQEDSDISASSKRPFRTKCSSPRRDDDWSRENRKYRKLAEDSTGNVESGSIRDSGENERRGGGSFSRVPWHLLDELDAEKTRLAPSSMSAMDSISSNESIDCSVDSIVTTRGGV